MDDLTVALAGFMGVEPQTLLLILGMIVAASNLIGKAIPDSATGWLATVRKIAKVLGLYIGNRITPRISANDTSKAIAATIPDAVIKVAADRLPEAIETGTRAGDLAGTIVDIAEGRRPSRPYVEGESPEQGSIVPDEYRTDPFGQQKGK